MRDSWKTLCLRVPMPRDFATAELLAIILLVAVTIASWVPRLRGPIDMRWDGGVYYVLGTSLAEGKGYRLLNEPGEIEAIQYPPLLPAIIAVHQIVLGTSDPAIVGHGLRLSFFCLYVVLVLATYFLLRAFLSVGLAFCGAAMFVLNIFPTFFSDVCFAEIPFTLAIVLFALCHRRRESRVCGACAGIMAMLAFLLRTAGIAMLAAWVLESVAKREFKRAAARTLVAAIPVVAWQIYIMSVQGSAAYARPAYDYQRAPYMFSNVSYATNLRMLDPFRPEAGEVNPGQLAAHFVRNLRESPGRLAESATAKEDYWKEFIHCRDLESPGARAFAEWLVFIVLSVIGILILGGVFILGVRRHIIIPAYIAFSLFGVCLIPWQSQALRYWTPTAPFLVLALLLCVKTLWEHSTTWIRPAARWGLRSSMVLVVGAIVATQGYGQYLLYRYDHQVVRYQAGQGRQLSYRLFFYDEGFRSLDAVLDKLKQIAKPDDMIGVSIHMPQWIYLRTGLKTVMTPFEADSLKAQKLLDSVPVDYLVLNTGIDIDSALNYMLPVVHRYPELWNRVYGDKGGTTMILERTDRHNLHHGSE